MQTVAITGMPGAGKSSAAKALENIGMKRVVMGDVIREETKRRGLAVDEKNTGEVMRDLRKVYGEGAVAELCLKSLITSPVFFSSTARSEEHTSELQSLAYLVCRLLLEKKKTTTDR